METSKWPARLDVCVVADFLAPGEGVEDDDDLLWFHCCQRWCDARIRHLKSLGYGQDDAQAEGVGPFPALGEEQVRANEEAINKGRRRQ